MPRTILVLPLTFILLTIGYPLIYNTTGSAHCVWTTGINDFNDPDSQYFGCEVNQTNRAIQLMQGGDWLNRTNVTPIPRLGCAMSSLGESSKVVLFGGRTGQNFFADTWVYDVSLDNWTEIKTTGGPSGRVDCKMCPVFGDDKVVLFGGEDLNVLPVNDTWLFDLSDKKWYNMTPSISPSSRYGHAMASIYNDDKMVLFGGWNDSVTFGDTWIYDVSDTRWSQIFDSGAPDARQFHAMATIPIDNNVLLFGGYNLSQTFLNDTWVFNSSVAKWVNKNPTFSPTPRSNHEMSTIFRDDKVVLYAGENEQILYPETWTYDLSENNWTIKQLMNSPGFRDIGFGFATCYATNETILFGGRGIDHKMMTGTWLLYLEGYSASGIYYSPVHDMGFVSGNLKLNWSGAIPENTSIVFQLRSGNTSKNLALAMFAGPDGNGSLYYVSPGVIDDNVSFERWIQYKALLISINRSITPLLKTVELQFNNYPRAPELLTPQPDAWINNSHPTFIWTFNDPDSSVQGAFECQVGQAPDETQVVFTSGNVTGENSSHRSVQGLSEGSWYWRVRTMDADGDWGEFSAFNRFHVDLTAPELVNVSVSPDNWTNKMPIIRFDAIDNQSGMDKIEIWIDEHRLGSQESPYQILPEIKDGIHNVIINAIDRAGNVQDAMVTVYIDRTPPELLNILSSGKGWSSFTPVIEFSATDNTSGIEHYDCQVDDGKIIEVTSPYDLPNLKDGNHMVVIKAFDFAGNIRDANITIFIDTTKPEYIFLSTGPSGWRDETPELSFNAEDEISGIEHYELSFDEGGFFIQSSPFTPTNLSDGTHKIRLRAFDFAGNYMETEATLLLDTTPPENLTASAIPGSWTMSNPQIIFEASDSSSGIDFFEIQIDNGKITKAISPDTIKNITDGKHLVNVKVFDKAGNSRITNVTIFIDRTPPIKVTLTINGSTGSTHDREVQLVISAFDNASGLDQMCFSDDGLKYSGWEPFVKIRNWTLTPDYGKKTVYVKVKDRAGNEARAVTNEIMYSKPLQQSGFIIPTSLKLILIIIIIVISVFALMFKFRRMKKR